jgi:hypothetical protein
LLVVAGWFGAVALAVLVGLGAISVIGQRLTSSDSAPKTEAEVARDLAALPSAEAASSSPVIDAPAPANHARGASGVAPATTSPAAIGNPPTTDAPPPGEPNQQPQQPVQTTPGAPVRTTTPASVFTTRGGIVVARCSAGVATITSMSPADGFSVHERRQSEGEFRSTSDNNDRVRFTITCSGSRPSLVDRGGGSNDH